MDQNTLNFIILVANAVRLAEQGNMQAAQRLLPEIKDWIRNNAPQVNI